VSQSTNLIFAKSVRILFVFRGTIILPNHTNHTQGAWRAIEQMLDLDRYLKILKAMGVEVKEVEKLLDKITVSNVSTQRPKVQ